MIPKNIINLDWIFLDLIYFNSITLLGSPDRYRAEIEILIPAYTAFLGRKSKPNIKISNNIVSITLEDLQGKLLVPDWDMEDRVYVNDSLILRYLT